MTVVRTETRLIRPFIGIGESEELIQRVVLKQGSSEYSYGPVVLPGHQIKEGNFQITTNVKMDELIAACNAAHVPPDSTKYVVFANSRSLRKSTLVFEQSITDDRKFPDTIEIEDTYDDELSRYVFKDTAGFFITVALVVAEDLPRKALVASQAGTFLARGTFSIKPEEDFSNFSPEPLTDLLREQFSLPKNSMTYIDIGEGLLQAEDLSEVVTVYLDTDVLNLLLQDESDEASKIIQTNLAIQTVEALTRAVKQELDADGLGIDDLAVESGGYHFLSKLADDFHKDIQEVLDMASMEPHQFHSFLEARFKTLETTEDLLKGAQ